MARDHGGVFFFASEASTGFGLHDADAILSEVEEFHEGLVHVIGALHGTPDRDPILGIGYGHHPVGFDVELLLRAGAVFAFDDVVSVCPDGIGVALFHEVGLEDVVFAPDELLAREGVLAD